MALTSTWWHLAKTLSSARQKVFSKESIADIRFAKTSLPRVTLVNAFAECFLGFAECLKHSAKKLCPVVTIHRYTSHITAI
jgi:hypothetical protein